MIFSQEDTYTKGINLLPIMLNVSPILYPPGSTKNAFMAIPHVSHQKMPIYTLHALRYFL